MTYHIRRTAGEFYTPSSPRSVCQSLAAFLGQLPKSGSQARESVISISQYLPMAAKIIEMEIAVLHMAGNIAP